MLRILDARTGEPVPAAPARRGLTRIEARASGLDPTALRVLLTADLLVRALELGGTPVWTILTAPHRHAELRAAATTLSIRPFEDGHDLASGLGEAQAIHVTAEPADACGEGPVVWVAPVEWAGEPPSDWAGWASAGRADGDADTDACARAGGSSGAAMEPGVAGAAERAPGPASGPTPESASEAAPGRMPGSASEPDTESAPGRRPEPASGPAPGRMTEPASESAPGRMSEPSPEPDTASEPDTESAPGRRSGPASRPAHGRGSEPASQPGPGRTPEPAAGPAFEPAPSPAPGPASGPAVHAALPFLLADPAALRLALLSVPRTAPVRLDSAVLDEAARRLARWRRAVAGWARQPSRPVPDEVRARLRSAWEDDLDLPAVLDVLRAVASAPDLPDGARFETYVYADRLLALDLARDLGSLA